MENNMEKKNTLNKKSIIFSVVMLIVGIILGITLFNGVLIPNNQKATVVDSKSNTADTVSFRLKPPPAPCPQGQRPPCHEPFGPFGPYAYYGGMEVGSAEKFDPEAINDISGKIVFPKDEISAKVLNSLNEKTALLFEDFRNNLDMTFFEISSSSKAIDKPVYFSGCNDGASMNYILFDNNWYYWNGSSWGYSAFNDSENSPQCLRSE